MQREVIGLASNVFVTAPNGTVYVYENVSYWDKEEKKTKHKRKCIGHIDPATGDVTPNRKKKKVTAMDAARFCDVKGIGVSKLLNRIAELTGVREVLKFAFEDDWKQILSCAYYLIGEGNALSRIEQWSAANTVPFDGVLTSQRVSDLLIRITGGLQLRFFAKWIRHNRNGEYCALDITSVSSYSEMIDFLRRGYNRDKEKLPQINLLLVSGEKSHVPLFFKILPGSIKDVSALVETLNVLDMLDSKIPHVVMDKGFYSEVNVDALYDRHIKFLVGVPFTVGYANEYVDKARKAGIFSHTNYRMIFDDEVYVMSESIDWKGHRCYVHVCYDSIKAEAESRKFDRLLYVCFGELTLGKRKDEHRTYYERFFTVKETPKRGRKVEYRQDAIDRHRENTTGWFVMIGNDVKDPVKALEIYRMKDTAEKAFDDLKNDLDRKRLRIHSTKAMEGRMFIQFIALILSSKIKEMMNEADWYKNYNMQQVIDEMKALREVKTDGRRKSLISAPTAFQDKIIKLFGLEL
jgi:transposase